MRKKLIILYIFSYPILCSFAQSKYEKDFRFMWNTLKAEYAYFDSKLTNWEKVKKVYQQKVREVSNDTEFVRFVENVIYELYDAHISINKNLNSSFRLIPSYTDAWIVYDKGKYIVADVRPEYEAEKKGLLPKMVLISVNKKPIDKLVTNLLPKSIENPNNEIKTFFSNLIFAGRRNEQREIVISYNGNRKTFQLKKPTFGQKKKGLLESKILKNNIGYIKINNSLGRNDLIKVFDSVVNTLLLTKAIILDVRETPDGGNTTVARAIMGKFIDEQISYQKHEYPAEERAFGVKRSWIEYVSPLEKGYYKPVMVLVGRWTGSIGEALALGFDKIPNAKVIGTKMAGLLGAITCYKFKETEINLCFPFEKLFHTNGIPREDYSPFYKTNSSRETHKKVMELLKNE